MQLLEVVLLLQKHLRLALSGSQMLLLLLLLLLLAFLHVNQVLLLLLLTWPGKTYQKSKDDSTTVLAVQQGEEGQHYLHASLLHVPT